MTAHIVHFPARSAKAVFVSEAREGGIIVMALEHSWLHGDASSAFADAWWLSKNLGLPIRVTLQ